MSDAPRRPDEFALIARCFAPLARGCAGAFGLRDDAAVLAPTPGHELVATVDALVAGVHFLADDPPDLVARKLLRVNLSDLAAMGAAAHAYLLALALPEAIDLAWLDAFAAGLGADQDRFGVALAGGDTTATTGPLVLSLTALGEVPAGAALRRAGAGAGEDIYVSGTIGDAALALRLIEGRVPGREAAACPGLVARYRLPEPRTALGPALRGIATAMIDVSDGLAADLGHLCAASGVAAEVEFARLPLSHEAAALLGDAPDPALVEAVLAGGDDYELLFAAPPAAAGRIAALGRALALPLTRIGRTGAGAGVKIADPAGRAIRLARTGWRHF